MSIIHVTKENFQEAVLEAKQDVLLDFWAPWCGPCRMVAPIVEQIAEENDALTLGKINVDEEMELAGQFQITSIPTLVLLKEGTVAATMVGYRPKADILKMLEV